MIQIVCPAILKHTTACRKFDSSLQAAFVFYYFIPLSSSTFLQYPDQPVTGFLYILSGSGEIHPRKGIIAFASKPCTIIHCDLTLSLQKILDFFLRLEKRTKIKPKQIRSFQLRNLDLWTLFCETLLHIIIISIDHI